MKEDDTFIKDVSLARITANKVSMNYENFFVVLT
jgi:hypothetical protein